jgi:GT2 family glycosyltransferase
MVKVSVVIKALNEADNISAAVASALRAVAPHGGEVIVADSGSVDRTVEIARQFPITVVALADPGERCCGISPQLGYQHSDGEYVYVLDGDMELNAAFLAEALALLEREPRLAGVGGYIREMRIENLEFENRVRRQERGRSAAPLDVHCLNGGGLYRRAAIEEAGYLSDRNLHAYEEYDLGARLRLRGWRLVRLDTHAADHYSHAMKTFAMLWHRARSGYVLGSGEVLRAAIDGGYLARVLRELRALRAYGVALASWAVLIALPFLLARPWESAAGLVALALLGLAAMALRHRSLALAAYSLVAWQVNALGLVRGLLRRRRSPREPIASRVLQRAEPAAVMPEAARLSA